jgi:hypothetical protein
MTLVSSADGGRGGITARQALGIEWPLLWATAFAVFVLPEARIRVSIVPLEIALAFGAAFCFLRLLQLTTVPSRATLAALILCAFEVYYYVLHWMSAPFPLPVWYFVLTRAFAVVIAVMLVERTLTLGAERVVGRCVLLGAGLHACVIVLNALLPDLRPAMQDFALLYTSASARSVGAAATVYYDGRRF